MTLVSLGATEFVYRAFEPFEKQNLTLARVGASYGDQYRLIAACGDFAAEPSGALWHRTPDRAGMPVTGDWVAARLVGQDEAIVEAVLPRRTIFSRRAAGRREDQQPVATNVDLVFIVCGLDGDFNLRRIERYLALAVEGRVEPVLVLNKVDLCRDAVARVEQANAIAAGAAVITATTRSPNGLDDVRRFLAPGRTVALLGSSGVGKSSIVNALANQELLRTAEVRAHDQRGRHTTTHRELIPLPGGGILIDTPGMRELQLWASQDSVEAVFDEIVGLSADCRFRDCTHTVEEGCAVIGAAESGVLDADRLTSYRKLMGEARRHELLADPIAARERKQKWKAIHRAARKFYKDRR
jgi:ribosome biogenesis GTPase